MHGRIVPPAPWLAAAQRPDASLPSTLSPARTTSLEREEASQSTSAGAWDNGPRGLEYPSEPRISSGTLRAEMFLYYLSR